jgi:hypothetical protein
MPKVLMPWSQGDYRDCGTRLGELYMLRNKLWKSQGLAPTDCLCLTLPFEKAGQTVHGFGLHAAADVQQGLSGGHWLRTKRWQPGRLR